MTERKWDAFLSYAAEDLRAAKAIRDQLMARGVICFLAHDVLHGPREAAEWANTIDNALDMTGAVLVVITPHALASKWVGYEWRSVHQDSLAGRGKAVVVPMLVAGPDAGDLPRALRRYQAIDLRDPNRGDEALDRVAFLLRQHWERKHETLLGFAIPGEVAELAEGATKASRSLADSLGVPPVEVPPSAEGALSGAPAGLHETADWTGLEGLANGAAVAASSVPPSVPVSGVPDGLERTADWSSVELATVAPAGRQEDGEFHTGRALPHVGYAALGLLFLCLALVGTSLLLSRDSGSQEVGAEPPTKEPLPEIEIAEIESVQTPSSSPSDVVPQIRRERSGRPTEAPGGLAAEPEPPVERVAIALLSADAAADPAVEAGAPAPGEEEPIGETPVKGAEESPTGSELPTAPSGLLAADPEDQGEEALAVVETPEPTCLDRSWFEDGCDEDRADPDFPISAAGVEVVGPVQAGFRLKVHVCTARPLSDGRLVYNPPKATELSLALRRHAENHYVAIVDVPAGSTYYRIDEKSTSGPARRLRRFPTGKVRECRLRLSN